MNAETGIVICLIIAIAIAIREMFLQREEKAQDAWKQHRENIMDAMAEMNDEDLIKRAPDMLDEIRKNKE